VFKVACSDAKLRPVNPHALRHGFCTHMLRNGASIRVVSALAGHKTLNATVRYTRLNVGDLREVVKKSHPRGK
jgi:site-specific recombinase XerD